MQTEPTEDQEFRLAAFNQNHEAFRSLNQQMWQIPLIAMTLTGGLWFGVSRTEDYALFTMALLLLAGLANIALIVVLYRLRYVMGLYLDWLRDKHPDGAVVAEGTNPFNRQYVVRYAFQGMLGLAAAVSFGLLYVSASQADWEAVLRPKPESDALSFYRRHAADLADGYEALAFEDAHPDLVRILMTERAGSVLDILDVGAGTGRDAAWLAHRGHRVVAVEPSEAMQAIGKRLHSDEGISWVFDTLPTLDEIHATGKRFDLVILSAVWMHLPEEDRAKALTSVYGLLLPGGTAYLTLRIGPEEPSRGIHSVSLEDFRRLASNLSIPVKSLASQSDLLGRSHIVWQAIRIDRPKS
ncbi:class I SAM-dependent methyltransferase [Paragemmobacter ruber]|uniref:Methyltransferase domain-containing protein n=1 Tax=Paragemmobacter ruber TaxID=1985673 RepID=A0ABW9Y0N9_9RHOB|nr:class I SAM-dependent methyltransferase [Rhodobacter ruber]NBE06068.1 methyltransferase domain-containing protein [Rhodobacter ruber]